MEFKITREELQAALYLTQGVVERRTPVPILANVMLVAEGDGLTVSATDQQIGVRQSCAAKIKRKGSATANGRMLYDIVRELPDGEIALHSLDNHWIEISAGKSRFKVVGIDPREFPAMPKIPREAEKEAQKLPASVLNDMIQRTVFAVSNDETRANLNGIYVEQVDKKKLRMVATDGHRLAMVTRTVDSPGDTTGVILPRKGVLELRRLLEGSEDQEILLVAKAGVVHAMRGSVELSMRLVEGEFPDYKQVIPTILTRKLKVDSEAFEGALRRVSLVSSEMSHGVRLALENGMLKLSSMNPDRGEAEEEIEASFEGEPMVVGFNARYLLDVLGIIAPGTQIILSLGDELSPGLLEAEGDPDYHYVIMPMRL